jgi:IS5 family transposase
MRQIINPQLQLGEVDIGAVALDVTSRDDIPRLLRGLQHIYTDVTLREQVFAILAEVLPMRDDGDGPVSITTGRPGMAQWQILVLGVLRLGLNADYDRIGELANEHRSVRQLLGVSDWVGGERWSVQTLKDNLRLFTPAVLDQINQLVVEAGHALVESHPDAALEVRCDSVVVETDVHYPTDLNLLLDATRKVIETCAALCESEGLSDWRQSAYNMRCLKRAYRRLQQLKRSTAKDPDRRAERLALIEQRCRELLALAEQFLQRAALTRIKLHVGCRLPEAVFTALDDYMAHAERQIDQVRRRILLGERIPHHEKVFSIFEPHTEWINKGKAGVPVELGVRVTVSEDQYGFILTHRVMPHETDDQVAVPVVEDLKQRFPHIRSVSFDKGYHSPANQQRLSEIVDFPVLPKKGKCNATEREREHSPRFRRLRQQHSAVESAINALESHGLDRCPDHGIDGFKRYVAQAVLARNLHRLGAILLAEEAEAAAAERRRRKRAA